MNRIIFFVLILAGCNSIPKEDTSQKETTASKTYTWSQEEEQEFLLGCVDSAKVKMSEAAAFAQCKCILTQLKQSFPNMDSAAPALMDVNRASEFVAKCK